MILNQTILILDILKTTLQNTDIYKQMLIIYYNHTMLVEQDVYNLKVAAELVQRHNKLKIK